MTEHVRALGEGHLIRYTPRLSGTDDYLAGMVGLVSPITAHRRPLTAVPVGQRGALIAVVDHDDALTGTAACIAARTEAKTGILLGSGVIWANTPVPGHPGPADLIGCARSDGTNAALPEAFEAIEGLLARLEIHDPSCACTTAGHRPEGS